MPCAMSLRRHCPRPRVTSQRFHQLVLDTPSTPLSSCRNNAPRRTAARRLLPSVDRVQRAAAVDASVAAGVEATADTARGRAVDRPSRTLRTSGAAGSDEDRLLKRFRFNRQTTDMTAVFHSRLLPVPVESMTDAWKTARTSRPKHDRNGADNVDNGDDDDYCERLIRNTTLIDDLLLTIDDRTRTRVARNTRSRVVGGTSGTGLVREDRKLLRRPSKPRKSHQLNKPEVSSRHEAVEKRSNRLTLVLDSDDDVKLKPEIDCTSTTTSCVCEREESQQQQSRKFIRCLLPTTTADKDGGKRRIR